MKVTFSIEYVTVWGESLCLIARDRKYPMEWNEGAIWKVTLPDCTFADISDYTYVVMKDGLIRRTEWRHHGFRPAKGTEELSLRDGWYECPYKGCPFPRMHQAAIFDRPGFRGAGTAVPVFSLRSGQDFGIGEFRDLHALVDWARLTGQCIIQMLPVNDTTRKGGWEDSYPYSPVSSFALNPMYIHLQDIGVKENVQFLRLRDQLNSLEEIEYPAVFKAKTMYMRKAFAEYGEADMQLPEYRRFKKKNAGWLDEYSSFCAERDSDSPEYHCWIQFHLDKQLKEEVEYARKNGVFFKGDLPIGVSADSAEAKYHPELFHLDSRAGAPPDFFSKDGQNWGFPTYNWEEMAKDGYAWWKARLRKMAEYFDAFRIDHILGFFRIWEIPAEYQGGAMGHFNPALPYSELEIKAAGFPFEGLFLPDPHRRGCWHPRISPDTSALDPDTRRRFDDLYQDFFYHRHEDFWRRNAELKLPELLSATGMLACGEDLGMVPDCVPGVLDHEKILSLEMTQMEKGRPWPYLSVCATSSHDLPTIRMRDSKQDVPASECEAILRANLESVSMLAVFPIQDWLSIDEGVRRTDYMSERINFPADSNNKWKFRLHLNVEDLPGCDGLNARIAAMISDSRRSE